MLVLMQLFEWHRTYVEFRKEVLEKGTIVLPLMSTVEGRER